MQALNITMKNLDVKFIWGSTVKLYFEVPSTTSNTDVSNAILTALNPYNGNNTLDISHLMDGATTSYTKGIQSTTTQSQITSAINSAVTIIGGRGRRG